MPQPTTDGFLEAALARVEQAEAKYRSVVDLVPAITYTEDFGSGRVFAITEGGREDVPLVDEAAEIRARAVPREVCL